MVFHDVLFQLERIANALEVIADTKLEKAPKGAAPPVEFFDSTRETNTDEETKLSVMQDKIQEKMLDGSKRGLFFEEDGLSEEELMQL